MRGRKVDSEFLSNFISECISCDKNSTEEILLEAKLRLSKIDSKIKEVELLKTIRPKLLDVISTFDNSIKSKKDEINALSFFDIKNVGICKAICLLIDNGPTDINSIKHYKPDLMFAIKQLIGYNIISRVKNNITKGKEYNSYIEFNKKYL
jgi:hypothetical protein